MSHSLCSIISVLIVLTIQMLGQVPEKPATSVSFFRLTKIVDIHVHMEPEEWAKIQPPKDAKMGIIAIVMAFEDVLNDAVDGGHFWSEKSTRPGLAGYMGIDHQYGKADVTIDGESIMGVGVRYKGNGTFLEGQAANKLSLKIDFNEYHDQLECRGLTKINLNNNVTDPSMLREALSYELFREAGIPCSRVGFARVSASVPGEFEQREYGLYTLVEQVDKRFLKDRYNSSDGLLLKPSTFGVFRYFGEDWSEYVRAYVPKTEPKPEQQQRVIEFARLLNHSDDASFDRQVGDFLDVDQFLRFLAVNVLLSNLDSFLGATQNHYVYLEPRSNKFQFLPWDMDHSFGAFILEGTPTSRRTLSIDHPGGPRNALIERVLNIPRYKKTYYDYLDTYLDTIFDEAKMRRQISWVAEFLRPLVPANGPKAVARFEKIVADGPQAGEPHVLKHFVAKRRESVRSQLDGLLVGYIPFNAELKRFSARVFFGFAIALVLLLLSHVIGWIWCAVAGFRGSISWGFLNLFLYPVTPLIYGYSVRRDLGGRSAKWTLYSAICVLVWIGAAIAAFG